MVGDPNWLYSTIAQASAAIVAILGGFITAIILARRAEKTSLLNELSNKKEQLKELEAMHLIPESELTDQQRQRMEENAYAKRDKVASLKYGISNLESRLKAFAYPPLLGWGLGVLGYLTCFSIIMPVSIIALEMYYDPLKPLVLALFIAGLFAMFVYIAAQFMELRRKN